MVSNSISPVVSSLSSAGIHLRESAELYAGGRERRTEHPAVICEHGTHDSEHVAGGSMAVVGMLTVATFEQRRDAKQAAAQAQQLG